MRIDSLPLGTEIVIGISEDAQDYICSINMIDVEASERTIIIARNHTFTAIEIFEGSALRKWGCGWTCTEYESRGARTVDNFYGKTGWWVRNDILVELAVDEVIEAGQVCDSCRLPAPHKKPNMPNNKFLCSSCKVLSELL